MLSRVWQGQLDMWCGYSQLTVCCLVHTAIQQHMAQLVFEREAVLHYSMLHTII